MGVRFISSGRLQYWERAFLTFSSPTVVILLPGLSFVT